MASEKQFFFICQIFLAVKTVFSLSRNVFFNEYFIPASGNSVLPSIQGFVEVLKFAGGTFFKINLIPARGN